MEQSPLDNEDSNDDHEIRIVRLEVKMDQFAIALASLQRTVADGFAEQRQAIAKLRTELGRCIDEQSREHRRDIRWMTGLILTTTLATLGVLTRFLFFT